MSGDSIKRLFEDGERQDRGKSDPWKKLGDVAPKALEKQISSDSKPRIDRPKTKQDDKGA